MATDTIYTSPNFNSYYSVADITIYVNALDGLRDISSWATYSPVQQENLLLAATKDFNYFLYRGQLNDSVIAPEMQWPRSGVVYVNGVAIPDAVIPTFIGQYLSVRLFERIENQMQSKFVPGQNIKAQELGDLKQEFYDTNSAEDPSTDIDHVPSYLIIEPYVLASLVGTGTILISRT